MTAKTVRIIFNDDHSLYENDIYGGSEIVLDNVGATAAEIESALAKSGFKTVVTPLRARGDASLDDFIRELLKSKDALIFNLCEAAFGKSRLEMHVAALLELYGLGYTGSGPLTLGLALDKGLTKDILSSRDIMTPRYCILSAPPKKLKRGMSFPLIVKPLREDASIGIDSGSVVHTIEEFGKRVEFIIDKFKQPAIAEEYVDGREFNVAVIGNDMDARALPPAELTFVDFPAGAPKICSYEAKWITASPLYEKTVPVCPADALPELEAALKETALRAYDIMGCRDYARVDMRLGEDGILKVLEVNPNPDLSGDAGLARAASAAGMDYQRLISGIVNIASERQAVSSARAKVPA